MLGFRVAYVGRIHNLKDLKKKSGMAFLQNKFQCPPTLGGNWKKNLTDQKVKTTNAMGAWSCVGRYRKGAHVR